MGADPRQQAAASTDVGAPTLAPTLVPPSDVPLVTPSDPTSATLTQMPGAVTPPDIPRHPQMIGGYQILEELGRGGMGVVYKASDLELKRLVALKMLWAGPNASPDELIRFRGEAELIAQLQHPNIVHVYDIGQHEGRPFLALEFVDGGHLGERTRGQPQPPRHAAETVETLARAIHAAHAQGIVHRDLKPGNVLVTRGGIFKITDFGLAKRLDHSLGCSRTGDVMGTPSYMAPEQAAGQTSAVGPATDVYALGAILYELLTGRPPFRGVSVLETLEQVRSAEPAAPSQLVPRLHRDLSTICLKCLQKPPGRRYASAAALADDLRRWLDGHPIQARPVGSGERLWRAMRRRPLLAALLALSLVTAVAMLVMGLVTREQAYRLQLAAQEQDHQKEIQRRDQDQRRYWQEQHDSSLRALNDILDLVTKDTRLSKQPGLEPLHQKLLEYYDQLIRQQEKEEALSSKPELAAACYRLGGLMRRTGNKADAVKALQKAQEIYETLPAGPEASHDLARCRLEKGILQTSLGRRDEAEQEYQAARTWLERLSQEHPNNPAYRKDLAEVWHNVGVNLAPIEKRKALEAYERALALRRELVEQHPSDPGYQRDLARSHGFIGDVELDLGLSAKADASYWESHRIRLRLAEQNKKEPEAQFQLARSWGNFGNYQVRVRALDTALYFFEKALKIQEELVASNPADTEYRSDLASSGNRLAALRLLKLAATPSVSPDQVEEVHALLRKSAEHFAQLLEADPQAVNVRRGLGDNCALLAQLLLDTDPAAAEVAMSRGRQLLEKLCSEPASEPRDLYSLAVVLAVASELPGGNGPLSAEVTEQRGRNAELAVQTLRKALERGFRDKHPDDVRRELAFKALRERQDFKELLPSHDDRPAGR